MLYNSSNIKVLKGLDAVRKRPGMYIGNVDDGTGLHHMVFELIDNSIDESLAGFCNKIIVTIYKDNSVSVLDNGRGIPVDIHKDEKISAAELVMTVLHAGGKFDNSSYKISGGLHGVGVSVVNALSKKLELKIYRNNKIYYQEYMFGVPKNKILIIGDTNLKGTFIKFWPDHLIFNNKLNFEFLILEKRLNQLSFLNSGLLIYLIDKRFNKRKKFFNNGGIKSFLLSLCKDKKLIHSNVFYFKFIKDDFYLEIVCQWVESFKENIFCFTNNIPQLEGGCHLSGLKSGITRTINNYIEKKINNKKNKLNVIGLDTREGLYSIISLKMFNPKFSSQTKNKLISFEVKSKIENLVVEYFFDFLLEYPQDSKLIINKILNSARIREATRKYKEIFKKKSSLDVSSISGKLADCQEKNPFYAEIFLVEGDSAGGSAKQGRNRKYQAILPLKGKIINVQKNTLDKILSSVEISTLVTALGCGIGYEDFNLNKLRYHNIIIMTDADVDGAHIRTLLLAFFYKYIPDIISNGFLYIAKPPLYRVTKDKQEFYIKNDSDLLYKVIYLSFKDINVYWKDNILLLKDRYLIRISVIYIYIKTFISNNKSLFFNFLFEQLIFFEKIDFNNIRKCYVWLINFLVYLNKNTFGLIFKGKVLEKNNNLWKINFYFKDNFNKVKVVLTKKFFIRFNIILIRLSKRIFFFNTNYKVYIWYKKVKKEFYSFYSLINFLLKKNQDFISIQRYKGLGEMNPDQLWSTTMDPRNRCLSKITIKNKNNADELFNILMGDNVKSRKSFIEKNLVFDVNKNYFNF